MNTSPLQQHSRASRLTLFLVVLIDLVGLGMIIPLLPTYAARMNADGLTLGCLLGVYGLMQFIFNPILGRLSDRIGRRPVLIGSQIGSAIGYSIFAVGDVFGEQGYATLGLTLLFVGRTIDGITGANLSAAQAAMSDLTDAKARAGGLGMLGAAFGVGFVVGPTLTALTSHIATWVPAVVAGGIALIAALCVAIYLPETAPAAVRRSQAQDADALRPAAQASLTTERVVSATPAQAEPDANACTTPAHRRRTRLEVWQQVRRDTPLLQLVLLATLNMFAFAFLHSSFVPLLTSREFSSLFASGPAGAFSQDHVGWLFTYIGMIIVIVQGGLVGRLSKRFGEMPLAMLGMLLLAAGFALVPLAFGVAALLGAITLYASGNGLVGPTLLSLISKRSPEAVRGEVLGLVSGMSSLAQAIGQPLAGALYDIEGFPNLIDGIRYQGASFWTASLLYLNGLAILIIFYIRYRGGTGGRFDPSSSDARSDSNDSDAALIPTTT